MPQELSIRLVSFLAVFVAVAVLERLAPRRPLATSRARRWASNLGLLALNPLSVRAVFPALPVGLALLAEDRGWGLLNQVSWPYWLELVIGAVILDFVIYLQHVLHHAVPTLWRLHMVHHADLDFDLTTGVRFHPLELVVSMAIKLPAVMALGPPATAVLLFEVLLNATSVFNHSNLRLPLGLDRCLRLLVVTPDMHRVHHSVIVKETNSNYGFNLPWWDRLLGTYRAQPEKGHDGMTIGLARFRDPREQHLGRLLILPFVGDPGIVPNNRR